jgi:hypothetical protein
LVDYIVFVVGSKKKEGETGRESFTPEKSTTVNKNSFDL